MVWKIWAVQSFNKKIKIEDIDLQVTFKGAVVLLNQTLVLRVYLSPYHSSYVKNLDRDFDF